MDEIAIDDNESCWDEIEDEEEEEEEHRSSFSSNLSEESEQPHLKSSENDVVVVGRKHNTEVVNANESDDWHAAEAAEIDRLLVTTTMHAIHLYQQPLDRCGDNTYY